jgi:PIN domain nuclease of toxin-antitoxin system
MAAVRLLLDTHVFLWWRADDRRLRATVRKAIAEAEIVFVSAASAWEAAIKVALGRLHIPDTLEAGVIDSGFEKLPINFSHAEAAARLPPHHLDPFDRMLIAQAGAEGLTLVTHDRRLHPYDVEILWT